MDLTDLPFILQNQGLMEKKSTLSPRGIVIFCNGLLKIRFLSQYLMNCEIINMDDVYDFYLCYLLVCRIISTIIYIVLLLFYTKIYIYTKKIKLKFILTRITKNTYYHNMYHLKHSYT